MRSNKIYENEGVGLVLREKSMGVIQQNDIRDNELEVAVEYQTEGVSSLRKNNSIGSNVFLPEKSGCDLI